MTFIIYPEKIVKWSSVNQTNGVISYRQSNPGYLVESGYFLFLNLY